MFIASVNAVPIINLPVSEIENKTQEKNDIQEIKIEEPIVETKETEPKEENTLAEIIREYQSVINEIDKIEKNNPENIIKWTELLKQKNSLELEIKKKTEDFNKKVEKKQEDAQKRAEEIRKEQQPDENTKQEYEDTLEKLKATEKSINNKFNMKDLNKWFDLSQKEKLLEEKMKEQPLEQTEQEKIQQNNRKLFDDIISRRNLQQEENKFDLNTKENTSDFLNDVQKLYEQKQEEDYQTAKKTLESNPTMTLEDLRKKLILEIDENTVNKVIDRFIKDKKIDNPLTEEEIAKMKEIEQRVNNELNETLNKKDKLQLTEEKLAKMKEIEQRVNNKLNETFNKQTEQPLTEENKSEMDKIIQSLDSTVDIKQEDRIYQKRVQEHEKELDEIYDSKEKFGNVTEQVLYVPKDENASLSEKNSNKPISNYERKKTESRNRLLNELSKKEEIEKKVKRKTTKEKYIEIRNKIGIKITNMVNNVDQFLSREPENIDELEEKMGRSK